MVLSFREFGIRVERWGWVLGVRKRELRIGWARMARGILRVAIAPIDVFESKGIRENSEKEPIENIRGIEDSDDGAGSSFCRAVEGRG